MTTQPTTNDGTKQWPRLPDSHSRGWLHVHSLTLPCVLLGLPALGKCRMGTHQMRIIGVNTNPSIAHSETLH